MKQTAILGAGVMGETLLSGLVRAGRRVDQLLVGEKRPERARELEERYGVAVVGNIEAASKADTVAIVVKPQDMADLLEEIGPSLRSGSCPTPRPWSTRAWPPSRPGHTATSHTWPRPRS